MPKKPRLLPKHIDSADGPDSQKALHDSGVVRIIATTPGAHKVNFLPDCGIRKTKKEGWMEVHDAGRAVFWFFDAGLNEDTDTGSYISLKSPFT